MKKKVPVRLFYPLSKTPFDNYIKEQFEISVDDSVNELIEICCKRCEINVLNVNLFGIWDEEDNSWLTLNLQISEIGTYTKLQLRMRFLFKVQSDITCNKHTCRKGTDDEDDVALMYEAATRYHYFQIRHDFFNDKVMKAESTASILKYEALEKALSIARLDLIIFHRSEKATKNLESDIKKYDYKKLLPKSFGHLISGASLINKKVIRYKFYKLLCKEIQKFSKFSDISLYKTYQARLQALSPGVQLTEHFQLSDNRTIKISGDRGIEILDNTESNFYDFTAIVDLKLAPQEENGKHVVALTFLNGEIIILNFESNKTATGFVSCIDGYFRLLVDPHHVICEELTPQSFKTQIHAGIFGPISFKEVEHHLRKFNLGYWLIRKSWENFDDYFLNVLDRDGFHVANVKIRKTGGGYNLLDTTFDCIGALLDFHKNTGLKLCLNKQVYPNRPIQSKLIITRATDSPGFIDKASIKVKSFESFKFVKKLGTGRFSESLLYKNNSLPTFRIVLKRHLKPTKRTAPEEVSFYMKLFNESMTQLSRLRHPNIIKLFGSATNMPNYFALEYCSMGSIIVYLKSCVNPKHATWFLDVFHQMAIACAYLEVHNLYHGNICGKNIMLSSDNPPFIKLGDSGVLQERGVNGRNPVLTYPWLSKAFLKKFILEATFSVQEDKWSFATTICEICLMGLQQPSNVLLSDALIIRAFSKIQTGDINIEHFKNKIKECWNENSQQRPHFRVLVRELSMLLETRLHKVVPECNEQEPVVLRPLKTYNDSELIVKGSLGSGNFGAVEKYEYNTRRGVEYIAIKTVIQDNSEAIIDMEAEIDTMMKVEHKYIVELKGVTVPSYRIVMEFLPHGSLHKAINCSNTFRTRDFITFCWQIADALAYLHSRGIVHRDLALRNILLGQNSVDGCYYAKVADFGLSRKLKMPYNGNECEPYYRMTGQHNFFPFSWYAPECLSDDCETYLCSSDVWSFGVTVWEMFSPGKSPWDRVHSIKSLYNSIITKGEKLNKPTSCPPEVYNILCVDCWNNDSKGRKTCAELYTLFKELAEKYKRYSVVTTRFTIK